MTVKPLRICKHPRCLTRVSSHQRYLCDNHQRNKWKQNANQKRSHFYESMPWRRFAKAYKEANPFCVECIKNNRTTLVDVADHIIPIRLGGKKFDKNNLQSLCHSCHNRKRQKEKFLY